MSCGHSGPTRTDLSVMMNEAHCAKGAEPAVLPPAWRDPREFLLAVMNDPQAPLALRVDAAKALLATPPGNAGDAPSEPSACPPGAHPP